MKERIYLQKPIGLGRSYVVRPEPGLVFGSEDLIATEAIALAVLKNAKRSLPLLPRYVQSVGLFRNPYVQGFDLIGVRDHPYIRHGITIGLGEMPEDTIYEDVPEQVQQRLNELLWGISS